jgi:hypothetical protein
MKVDKQQFDALLKRLLEAEPEKGGHDSQAKA